MGLYDLPAELRMHIYDFLPELILGRYETVTSKNALTPAICRVSRQIRHETLAMYVQNTQFIIQADGDVNTGLNPAALWLDRLGPTGIKHINFLQLSQHWKIQRPSRWQGHVGFYVQISRAGGSWQCTTGTYPIVKDTRGMRRESIELLQSVIGQRMADCSDLTRSDVDFLLATMDVVASHPIAVHDTAQVTSGQSAYSSVWQDMEHQLCRLNDATGAGIGRRGHESSKQG